MVRTVLCWFGVLIGMYGSSSGISRDWNNYTASPERIALTIEQSNDTDSVSPPLLGSTLAYGIDTSVSPCDDFYEYANGGWRKSVVFPSTWKPQRRVWSHMHQSSISTHAKMVKIIDSAYRSVGTTDNAALHAIGTFYSSCLAAGSLEIVLPRRIRKDSMMKDSTRSEQCVQRVLQYLSDASGQVFVEQFITKDIVDKMELLLKTVKDAARHRIAMHSFMNASEIEELQKRLDKLYLRVGIPDKKIDFSTLILSPSQYHKNKDAIANFNSKNAVNSIGGDIREKWKMSLLTANAMYNPAEHAIEIPTVMFQPPFFYPSEDDALNYSSIGYVIGHEVFHGLSSYLDHIDNTEIKSAIDSFAAGNTMLGSVDGWIAHGKRTYKEDIADLGGIRTAYDAWKKMHQTNKRSTNLLIDGFTPEQRFFIGFGRVWRAKWVTQAARNQDVHSAYFARVNGMVMQMPEFAAAFSCRAGDKMVLPTDKVSRLW